MLLFLYCYIYLCWTTHHRMPYKAGSNATPMLPIFWNSGTMPFSQSHATTLGTTAVQRLGVHDPPSHWPRGAWCHAGWRLDGVVAASMLQHLFLFYLPVLDHTPLHALQS